MTNISQFDVVIRKDGADLRSGAEAYSHAVVASVEPFVLVSARGDMRWNHQKMSDFGRLGPAQDKAVAAVKDRMARDVTKCPSQDD